MYRIAMVAVVLGLNILPVVAAAQSPQINVEGRTYRTPIDLDRAGSIFLPPRPERPVREARDLRELSLREQRDARPARPAREGRSAFNSGSPSGFYAEGNGTNITINSNNSDVRGFGSLGTAEQISILQQQLASGQLQGDERAAIQNAIELLRNK